MKLLMSFSDRTRLRSFPSLTSLLTFAVNVVIERPGDGSDLVLPPPHPSSIDRNQSGAGVANVLRPSRYLAGPGETTE